MKTRLLASCFAAVPLSLGLFWLGGCATPNLDEEPTDAPAPMRSDAAAQERPDAHLPPPSAPPAVADASAEVDAAFEAGPDAGTDPCTLPDLVACFTFEGTTLEDRSPTKLVPAYVQGLTFGAGRSGQGLVVGPVTNIRFAQNAALNGPSMTVEAFIKVAALPAADQIIFDADERFGMLLQPTGGIRCNGGGDPVYGGKVATGRWVHVACVFGGGAVRVYVDGALAQQGGGGPGGGSGQEAIGGDAPSGGQHFDGSIDTLRVFRSSRSSADIVDDAK